MKFFQYCKSSYKQTLQLSSKLEILICIFLSIYAVIRKIVHNNISKKFLYSLYVIRIYLMKLKMYFKLQHNANVYCKYIRGGKQ